VTPTLAIVCLGRLGDQMAVALPLAYEAWRCGRRPTLVVARDYADLARGVPYADCRIWSGHYDESVEAAEAMRREFDEVWLAQPYGRSLTLAHECPSFVEDAFRVLGRLHDWHELSLVLDGTPRELPRESEPPVLVALSGKSSPFPHRQAVWQALARAGLPTVDLDTVRVPRIQDLLPRYRTARCLVTVDSGPLHLANAVPELPVLALVADGWYGSPPRPSHVWRCRYSEWSEARAAEMVEVITSLAQPRPVPRATLLYSEFKRAPEHHRRHSVAALSWQREVQGDSAWRILPVPDSALKRDSRRALRDKRALPFVRDLVEAGVRGMAPHDILVLTNDDVVWAPGLAETLLREVSRHSAAFAARWEFGAIRRPLHLSEMLDGRKHVGRDLFAFTAGWWARHGHDFPDMVYSSAQWDYVMATLIRLSGGVELHCALAHEVHPSAWFQRENIDGPANKHNRALSEAWHLARGLPVP
jgi:hypothetical protein